MKYPFAIKDGDKLAVLRPKDPQLALKLAYEAMEIEDEEEGERAFQNVLNAQPYSFVGLMSTVGKPDRKILDENGWAIGKVRAGDSFAPYTQLLAQSEAAAQAIVNGDEKIRLATPDDTGNVLQFEVQQDGTLGPVRDKS